MKLKLIPIFILFIIPSISQAGYFLMAEPVLRNLAMKQLGISKVQSEILKKQLLVLKSFNNITKHGFESLKRSVRGSYGYGQLFNRSSDHVLRRIVPIHIEQLLAGEGGSEEFRTIYAQYAAKYPQMDLKQIDPNYPDGILAKLYLDNVRAGLGYKTLANIAYKKVNMHLRNIETLMTTIDGTTNIKAAMDLNSRIIGEAAFLQIEKLRLEALLLYSSGNISQENASHQAEAAVFNQWG